MFQLLLQTNQEHNWIEFKHECGSLGWNSYSSVLAQQYWSASGDQLGRNVQCNDQCHSRPYLFLIQIKGNHNASPPPMSTLMSIESAQPFRSFREYLPTQDLWPFHRLNHRLKAVNSWRKTTHFCIRKTVPTNPWIHSQFRLYDSLFLDMVNQLELAIGYFLPLYTEALWLLGLSYTQV